MSGTLHVVATPIGNLEDITLRALRVLREADLIAAEDTRRTAKLLTHFAIPTATISFHTHNARQRMEQLLPRLQAGQRIALVTDAGTPGISDPGAELVAACLAASVHVEPVPGVSAPLTAAIVSGFPLIPLTICGFAPHKSRERESWLQQIARILHTVTFFETPHRIAATIAQMSDLFGDRPIVVARELTKAHEEILRGTATALAHTPINARGEFTIVVGPAQVIDSTAVVVTDAELAAAFWQSTENGASSRREAITSVAERFEVAPKRVYAAVERARVSGE